MDENICVQELDLKNVLFAVLEGWRTLIITAILFSLLTGGYICGKALLTRKNQTYMSMVRDDYNKNASIYNETKKQYEDTLGKMAWSIENQEKYIHNSILMNVDPYNKYTVSVDVFVKMSNPRPADAVLVTTPDYTFSLIAIYASIARQDGTLEELAKEEGVELTYLKELVAIETDTVGKMFHLTVTDVDEQRAEEILDIILTSIQAFRNNVETNLGRHDIAIMNRSSGIVADPKMADYQKKKLDDLLYMKQDVLEEKKLLGQLIEPKYPVILSEKMIIKEAVLYSILGMFIGIFVITSKISMCYILSGKLHEDSDLKHRFGLKYIGSLSGIKQRKLFSFIDNWVEYTRGRESTEDELVYQLMALRIQNFNSSHHSLFLTGRLNEGALIQIAEEFQKRMPEFWIGCGTELTHRISTLEEISKYEEVLLVEIRGESRYRDIEKDLEFILNIKKMITGYIVVPPERYGTKKRDKLKPKKSDINKIKKQ